MYAIYDNIYHPYTPNVSIYTSTMDPMGTDETSQQLIDLCPGLGAPTLRCLRDPWRSQQHQGGAARLFAWVVAQKKGGTEPLKR